MPNLSFRPSGDKYGVSGTQNKIQDRNSLTTVLLSFYYRFGTVVGTGDNGDWKQVMYYQCISGKLNRKA